MSHESVLTVLALGFFILVGFGTLAESNQRKYELCLDKGNQWVSGDCIYGGKDE